jgi:RNA polymerase sigma factor (sigma-70 family)
MTETLPASAAPDSDDAALLDRLRAGEDAAFGELFSRHSSAVFRLALGLVSDRAEAEDLTAEAFFRVLQAIRRGSGPVDNVRGYLLIVARRVAWEWSVRRRDVPVSDEELTHRAPSNPDTVGLSTERNLIRRAFTSLPERWRNVLWKMEVEGERPAAVATKFGLSANATAALARRARQGLRAAYLQAHLAADRSATGCRSVLEKLGAYTAGTTMGIERRRIRAHLAGCPSCAAMYAELRDVCSGLRAHAAFLTVPVVAAAGLQAVGGGGVLSGFLATVKGLAASAKVQVGVAATSAATVGVLGFVVTPFGGEPDPVAAPLELNGRPAAAQEEPVGVSSSRTSISLPGGTLTGVITVPETAQDAGSTGEAGSGAVPATDHVPDDGGRTDVPTGETLAFDESSPIVYREYNVQRQTEEYPEYTLVHETTAITEVNELQQTRTMTETTSYVEAPGSSSETPTVVTSAEPTSEMPPTSGP